MANDNEKQLELSRLVLDHAVNAYQQEADTWRDLELKSQATIGIAGIFLTGAYILLSAESTLTWEKWLVIGLIVVAVSITAILGIVAILIADLVSVETGAEALNSSQDVDLNGEPAASNSALSSYLRERAAAWSNAEASLGVANGKKASLIEWSQWFLLGAVVLMVFYVGVFMMTLESDAAPDCGCTDVESAACVEAAAE